MATEPGPSWADISEQEAATYRRILAGEPLDGHEAATDRLLNFGLIRVAGNGYIPVDPTYATARLQAELLNAVTAISDAFRPLAHDYENRPGRQGLIEYLQGSDNINARLSQVLAAASEELLFCQPGGIRKPEILEETNDRDLAALRRGVAMRTLYREEARYGENMDAWVARMEEAGAQFRTLDEGFQRFFVIDRKIAVVPGNAILDTSNQSVAYMVHDPGIANFLVGQFERDWERAESWAHHEVPGALTRRQRRVLEELRAGGSHQSIARKLNIRERAVAEVIAKLKEHYGVQTLFALACAWKEDDC